ncbi:DUF2239 family protein [Microbulbifer elongatus]|uniref:DUF2239 family protein n=1 Tax=Microbulbifer elongatus TaxID=86173 RepID=UPI001E4E79A3|nr:DUF2239 family protein [Microbulbifer elongatus]
MTNEYVAILAQSLVARGSLASVVREAKARADGVDPIVLEIDSCKRLEIDWHGDPDTIVARVQQLGSPAPARRGRPKLGVTSKEVTLLPRHWEWLATQRGGASVTLRRLVDAAMKNATAEERISMKQNQLYNLLNLFADAPGFEEAARSMYRNSRVGFEKAITDWSADVRDLLLEKFDEIAAIHQGQENEVGE